MKQQPLVSFFQDRLISLLEDPNSHMFNDAIGLVRELVNSDDFDSLLEKLIISGVKNHNIRPCPASP